MSVIPIPYRGNPSSINMVEYEHKWWICDTEWRQVRTEMICDAGWWHFSTWRFHEKKSLAGIGIRTHDLVSSCLVITFLSGICISAINHFVPIGSQYSGGSLQRSRQPLLPTPATFPEPALPIQLVCSCFAKWSALPGPSLCFSKMGQPQPLFHYFLYFCTNYVTSRIQTQIIRV